jgi:hypothetical protein
MFLEVVEDEFIVSQSIFFSHSSSDNCKNE